MEQEKHSRIEAWLRDLFGDIGNLAVSIHAMGGFKPTVEEEASDETEHEVEEQPRKVLHPSMIKQRTGEYFIPSRYKRN